MTKENPNAGMDAVAEQAAEWFARLQGEDAVGDDWLAFETWLAVPAHAAAYERLEALWVALEDDAPAIRAALDAPVTAASRRELPRRAVERRPTRRAWLAAGGALAASLVAGVFVVANWPTPCGASADLPHRGRRAARHRAGRRHAHQAQRRLVDRRRLGRGMRGGCRWRTPRRPSTWPMIRSVPS